jgi:hypothetical protein
MALTADQKRRVQEARSGKQEPPLSIQGQRQSPLAAAKSEIAQANAAFEQKNKYFLDTGVDFVNKAVNTSNKGEVDYGGANEAGNFFQGQAKDLASIAGNVARQGQKWGEYTPSPSNSKLTNMSTYAGVPFGTAGAALLARGAEKTLAEAENARLTGRASMTNANASLLSSQSGAAKNYADIGMTEKELPFRLENLRAGAAKTYGDIGRNIYSLPYDVDATRSGAVRNYTDSATSSFLAPYQAQQAAAQAMANLRYFR